MKNRLNLLCNPSDIFQSINEFDLPFVYKSAHLFCLVSEKGKGKGEGIPLTPMEALASGLPIIVGNHDGSKELIFKLYNV